MDISLIYELETNDTSDDGVRRVYQECLEQVKLADELGYRAVWFTEHHFLPGFSDSSAPEVFHSYLAANTKHIRLGHGIVLLPFRINHPLRVAERIAVLDLVPNGRAVGRAGARPVRALDRRQAGQVVRVVDGVLQEQLRAGADDVTGAWSG